MAYTFPVSLSLFSNKIRAMSFKWELEVYHEVSGLPQGYVLTNEIAEPRWRADVEFADLTFAEAAEFQSILSMLITKGSDGTFFLSDTKKSTPVDDTTNKLSGFTPKVSSLSGRRGLAISGLPVSYKITAGDMVQITSGSQRTLYQVTETVTAASNGTTPLMDVAPYLKSFVAVGDLVYLYFPASKVIVKPGTFTAGAPNLSVVSGMAFSAIEIHQ